MSNWFKLLNHNDRKNILCLLHDFRRSLKDQPAKEKIIVDLLYWLESLNERASFLSRT